MDSVPPFRLDAAIANAKVTVLSVAPLFGDAIWAIHSTESIVELLTTSAEGTPDAKVQPY
jgi:phosphoribosylpyrophosphate synthetase